MPLYLILFTAQEVSTAQNQSATITVDVQKIVGNVNPLIFGNNILAYQKGTWKHATADYWDRGAGIWDPEAKRSVPEMLALAKVAGMSVVRYPGGEAAHYFDWKKTIGPIVGRPDQKFGLPEFLQFCSDVGAIPLITIPEVYGTAQDAAELVEYLNAQNDGKHIWAKLRADDGYAKPWDVVWFEYGNEIDFGYGLSKKIGANEYAQNYLIYQRSMKSVDPRIKLGLVGTTAFPDLNRWFHPVLEIVKDKVDFVIHHAYLPDYTRNDNVPSANELFTVSLACQAQMQDYYDHMNELMLEISRRRVPIAVTEYNGHFTQLRPVNYRFTLGNALLNAEMIKLFLNPANNIIMANSWQFSNEAWGAVRGYSYKNDVLMKRPLFYVFQLYHEHFGKELLSTYVHCDTYETGGGYGVLPAKGAGQKYQLIPDKLPLPTNWDLSLGVNFSQHLDGKTLVVDFRGSDVNYYHAHFNMAAEPLTGYRVTAWIKTEEITSANGVGFSVLDARGWDATKSSTSSVNITGTHDWQKVEVEYVTLADAKGIQIQARRVSGSGPISGRAYFRDVTVQKSIPQAFPAVPYLSVNASRTFTANQQKVYLMVVNKSMDATLTTTISINGLTITRAKAWILNGPSVDATNENDPNTVALKEVDFGKVSNGFPVWFPPHSLTALEIE